LFVLDIDFELNQLDYILFLWVLIKTSESGYLEIESSVLHK